MQLKPDQRFFLRFELELRPQRDKGAALPLRVADDGLDVLTVLQQAIDDGTAVFQVTEGEDDFVRLTQAVFRPRSNQLVLLFRRSSDGSAPMFENRATRELRRSDKQEDEFKAYSAHLFVSLDESPGAYPKHRALLEEVPGLGRTYIQELLRRILRLETYDCTDERGRLQETYTIPHLRGIASETLRDGVRGGGIKYIELVRQPRLDGLDTAGLIPRSERLRLSVREGQRRNFRNLANVKAWGQQHGWDRIRVQVETADERTRVVDISREADASDVLFVRAERVEGIAPPLEECTDEVVSSLVRRARRIFASDNGW
jgi:hypothetical protein